MIITRTPYRMSFLVEEPIIPSIFVNMGDQYLLHLSINIATYLVGSYRLFSITNIVLRILKSKQHEALTRLNIQL